MSVKFHIVIILCFVIQNINAQNIVIVNQLGESIDSEMYISVSITNRDTTISLKVNNSHLQIKDSICNQEISMYIEGKLLQPFYNEFRCDQISDLDTITVHQKFSLGYQTPRLLLGMQKDIDSIFNNKLWIKDWLEENESAASGISFWVYNCDPLNEKDTSRIKAIILEYCSKIDYNHCDGDITFKNAAYTTSHEDIFNANTEITRTFIDNQNTLTMKKLAEQYSTVVMIVLNWKHE